MAWLCENFEEKCFLYFFIIWVTKRMFSNCIISYQNWNSIIWWYKSSRIHWWSHVIICWFTVGVWSHYKLLYRHDTHIWAHLHLREPPSGLPALTAAKYLSWVFHLLTANIRDGMGTWIRLENTDICSLVILDPKGSGIRSAVVLANLKGNNDWFEIGHLC